MDAEQLWETTLDPERRLLKLVEIEDARMASEMTELLMGTDVRPEKPLFTITRQMRSLIFNIRYQKNGD